MKKLLLWALFALFAVSGYAQRYAISGTVRSEDTKEPVNMAVITLAENNLWAVADGDGYFEIKNIQPGEYQIQISCLGYITYDTKMNITDNFDKLVFSLRPDNLTIDKVTVTASQSTNSMSTTRTIEKTALEHLQMADLSDISSLMPGGTTRNPYLTNDAKFSLREGGFDTGHASFGTALELDGVRQSTNASMGDMEGASTRSISTTNIESVEVVTGIPSAKYGDLTSGLIKVKTLQGKTPYTLTLKTDPRTKQVALSKGFGIGEGALNVSFERAKAIANPVSPYKSYARNGLTLNYSNTFNRRSDVPVSFRAGLSGNIGGMNTRDDPDSFRGTYEKGADNRVSFNTSANWLFNRSWITNLRLYGSVNYRDRLEERHTLHAFSSESGSIHATTEGYFQGGIMPVSYALTYFNDSKEFSYNAGAEYNWSNRWGGVVNRLEAGVSWSGNGNFGEGEYYKDLEPSGFRPYTYNTLPFMNNLAAYLEENVTIPIGKTSLAVMAGLRAEKTMIKGMAYDNARTLSPRFNMKYTVIDRPRKDGVRHFSIRGGWGVSTKLPGFNILYPRTSYFDRQVFSANHSTGLVTVFKTTPYEYQYNPDLKWMRNHNSEIGVDLHVGGTKMSLVGFYNKTRYPYKLNSTLEPYEYRTSKLGDYKLPDRYELVIDQKTGHIYVTDLDNVPAGSKQLETVLVDRTFLPTYFQDNGSDVTRKGLEFVLDFGQIKAIRTSFKFDASYVRASYANEDLKYWYPGTNSPNGGYYEYAGIYVNTIGRTFNARVAETMNANLTVVTQIPVVRMVVSLRVEAHLIDRWQLRSEYKGQQLAYKIASLETKETPVAGNIYDGNTLTAMWPLYYINQQGDRIRFTETEAADPRFSDLIVTGVERDYNPAGYDPYVFANISVTKEIGNIASVSFYANNFTNMRKFQTEKASRAQAVLAPDFFYGLTLRLKF